MPVDKEWVGDVLADDAGFVNVDVIDIIYQVNSSALTSIGWFDNPDIFLRFMLFELLVMVVEVTELVWEDVCVWDEVKGALAEAFLHADKVETHSVLASYFMALREMVNFLVLI